MHSPVRFLSTSPESQERVRRLLLSPLLLLRSDCPVGFSQTRNSLKVSQPCGLKNDLLCSRPLRACSHLENRQLSRSGRLCQVGCATVPEDFTCPLSLDETGKFDWTSRSLHLSCRAGQARSTGLLYKKPEAFTRPTAFGWPGLRLCLSSL